MQLDKYKLAENFSIVKIQKVPRGIPVGKMEWLFLAAGTGLYAMSKSKNMKQIDKVILLIATKVRGWF